jgi:putative oxidoreductase
MNDNRFFRSIGRAYALLDRIPLSIPLLVARIATFSVFLRSGLVKLSDWSGTLDLFRDEYMVPIIPYQAAAFMAAGMELGCSTLILLGLLTRVSVLALFGMIATIQIFVYPTAWPDHIQWTGFMLFLLLRGPGAISLDHLIAKRWRASPGN